MVGLLVLGVAVGFVADVVVFAAVLILVLWLVPFFLVDANRFSISLVISKILLLAKESADLLLSGYLNFLDESSVDDFFLLLNLTCFDVHFLLRRLFPVPKFVNPKP